MLTIIATIILAITAPFAALTLATPYTSDAWLDWLERVVEGPAPGAAMTVAPILAALAGGYLAGVHGAWAGYAGAGLLAVYAALTVVALGQDWLGLGGSGLEGLGPLMLACWALILAVILALATWGASALG